MVFALLGELAPIRIDVGQSPSTPPRVADRCLWFESRPLELTAGGVIIGQASFAGGHIDRYFEGPIIRATAKQRTPRALQAFDET